MKKKFFIVTTVPVTLWFFKGQIQVLKKLFDVELVSSPDDVLNQLGDAEDVQVRGVEMKREISIINDLKSLLNLFFLFRKHKPQVVHGNTPKGGLLSMTAAFLARVPKRIYCVHGLRYEGNTGAKGLLLRSMEKLSCLFATEIVAVSFGIGKTLKKDRITTKSVNVIGNGSINGIDPSHFSPELFDEKALRKEYQIDEDACVFGFVGRLVGDKGTNELIEAFIDLNKEDKKVKLLLVGGYEEELDPVKASTKDSIANHPDIISVGFQNDIRPYLMMMDVFTFPSYREGFGVSIMEAGAMGVPAISSDISGCNEIIKDGYNGVLIQPRSVEDLKSAMERLISEPDYIDLLSKESRDYIIGKYDQKVVWDAISNYYSDVN